jgi:multidrug efflux system membrane fusion protein
VRVSVAPVEKADFPVYLTGLGTVQGFNTVVVRTRVDGQIDKIAFTEGQEVKQGDLLAEIDPRPYQATLDQAKAKKAQDEANLFNANLDLDRYTKLGEFATRQQLDTQRSTVQQLTAQIAADVAAIANAQTQLDYTAIKSPISGVVGLRLVDIGNIVNAATQTGIVTIAQIEPIAVIFTAPEEHLPYINEAQAIQPLKTIAITTDGKKPLAEGKAGGGQQSGRLHQRHHPPQGGIRQQEPRLVAGPIGIDAASGEYAEGCHGGSGRSDPAWHRWPLRLCRQPGQQG